MPSHASPLHIESSDDRALVWLHLVITTSFPKSGFDSESAAGFWLCCTAFILALSALKRPAWFIATGWFLFNVLGVFWFLAIYDGHS